MTMAPDPIPAHPVTRNGPEQLLGQGRSGIVFLSRTPEGTAVARKVFGSHGLPKLVHYLLSGAPNPYMWSEAAVGAAVARRRILEILVGLWFGSKLRVAAIHDHGWNAEARAFEIACEFVDGRHTALHHPFTPPWDQQLAELRGLMGALQGHLAEAGFDGLVWQAGRGNPVALNNFMCEAAHGESAGRWVWIDLESGVPALFPLNVLELFRFYLPRSLHHGRALFDDVDVPVLRAYFARRRAELLAMAGHDGLERLARDIDALEEHQRAWKSQPRHRRSIAHRLGQGEIDASQAAWYGAHPVHWYGRELRRNLRAGVHGAVRRVAELSRRLGRIRVGPALHAAWRLVSSQEFRTETARGYVTGRIGTWEARGQLTAAQARELRADLESQEASAYVTDFGVHLAIKPAIKFLQWWALPALWAFGLLDPVVLAFVMAVGGPTGRTLYTLARTVQNARAGREKPWIALLVGTLPVAGNVAFPLQLVFTGSAGDATIAQFILYDTCSRIGESVPIWGGRDTLIEHVLNRAPDPLRRQRAPRPITESA